MKATARVVSLTAALLLLAPPASRALFHITLNVTGWRDLTRSAAWADEAL